MVFMNIYESEILLSLYKNSNLNQRELAELTGFSLGQINKSLRSLQKDFFVDENNFLLDKAKKSFEKNKPANAIILAAGIGMRMVPINTITPKGLLTVGGETLIERIIRQLHEKNIRDITVVVGFLKESYEYLIDKYNVSLVFNKDYAAKNNLHSLNCVKEKISNTYIIPCDVWFSDNIFSEQELYSWYSVTDEDDEESIVRVGRDLELKKNRKRQSGNKMFGVSYINEADSKILKNNIEELCSDISFNNSFWEDALLNFKNITVYSKTLSSSKAYEINSLEQLRELDSNSKELKNDSIRIICDVFKCNENEIKNIQTLKKGMTNRSFLFEYDNEKYIMRIPGEGTDLLINRKNEAAVYEVIKDHDICDALYYINPENGYKISKFINNSRVCDPENNRDLKKCMKKLKAFHDLNLQVSHEFDLFGQIDFYESLWDGNPSCYKDYQETKEKVLSLKKYIESQNIKKCLTHIDAVCDNFLFSENDKQLQLIDWEYSGMQDPHVDIAMFCIYALYDSKKDIDNLIDIYFENECPKNTRIKIYCYISICGLLWSNWCEYKRQLGVEFGEYSLKQYRYAKEYFRIANELINRTEEQKINGAENE